MRLYTVEVWARDLVIVSPRRRLPACVFDNGDRVVVPHSESGVQGRESGLARFEISCEVQGVRCKT